MMNFGLSGRQGLIIGASRGIGYALARQFAIQGALVTIVAQVDEVFAASESLTNDTGHSVRALKCDVTSREQVAQMAASIEQVDVLINNAGIGAVTSVDDVSD